MSVDYYTRLERGNLIGVSESVLDALTGALQLDEAERAYLFDLARTANTAARPRRSGPQRVRPVCSGSWTRPPRRPMCAPAAWTSSASTGSGTPCTRPSSTVRSPLNIARSCSSTPAPATSMSTDKTANDAVAILRGEAGRDLYDRRLSDLIGELHPQRGVPDPWAAHNVRLHRTWPQAVPPPGRRRPGADL